MKNIRNVAAIDGGSQKKRLASFRGFTLLEILISMTLLVLIVVVATGAMRLGSRSVAAGEKKIEAQERFRTVLSTIDAQIQSHIPLTYQEDGSKKYYFRGDKKALRFSTNYSIWNGRTGYVIVTYMIDTDHKGNDVLSASEQVPGLEGSRETRFMEASQISFEYFMKDVAEERGKWVEILSDGLTIPDKIRVRVTQGTKQMSLVFPVRVGGKMMVVQSGASPRGAQSGQSVRSRRQ